MNYIKLGHQRPFYNVNHFLLKGSKFQGWCVGYFNADEKENFIDLTS